VEAEAAEELDGSRERIFRHRRDGNPSSGTDIIVFDLEQAMVDSHAVGIAPRY
jgi:hypothetical protein